MNEAPDQPAVLKGSKGTATHLSISKIGMQRIAIESGGEQYGSPKKKVGLQEFTLYRNQLYAIVQGDGGIYQPSHKYSRQA
ncbi:hypothetical protein [Pseudomonas oryzihabitans]|uniref:hypothetical protein n=1 Tax=Pseudomonas oryzihabitans TaxID=47885 RepID=UPI0028A980FC|nr:hypothetical protein [Pseudomonas oryzihabitans]